MKFIRFCNQIFYDNVIDIVFKKGIFSMIKTYLKYFIALLLFGSNGIVANHITMNSYETVFARTLTGSLFLMIIYTFSKNKLTFHKNKKHFLFQSVEKVNFKKYFAVFNK